MNKLKQPESKLDLAYRIIKDRIDAGVYVPGYRLVLAPIAKELGISAVPVREAIRKLEAEGLVTFELNVGAQVAMFNETEYFHTMQTLALVEGYATALAAAKITPHELGTARSINQEIRETLARFDPLKITRLNKEFHAVLFSGCDNPHINELVNRGWERLNILRNSSFSFAPGRAEESVREHDEILSLIADQAPAAQIESVVREHRLRTLRAVQEFLPRRENAF